jgi:hypothetical protein
VPWFSVEGQWKMFVDFAVVIRVASVLRIWQIKQLLDVPLSNNNNKKDFRKECCTH